MANITFSQIPGSGDVKVLNYALALEALETSLYQQALARLTSGGVSGTGKKIAGLGISSNQPDVFYVQKYLVVERAHRDFLDGALGGQSLLRQAPFNKAKFEFGLDKLNRRQVVELVYTAESLGVSAYLGAIPSLQTRTYLQTAGAIQGTEARHTAVFAELLNQLFAENRSVAPLATQNTGRDVPMTPDSVLAQVSGFIVL